MKKKQYLLSIGMIVLAIAGKAQQRNTEKPDSLTVYYKALAKTGTYADKLKIKQGLNALAKKNEAGINKAIRLAGSLNLNPLSDSLLAVAIKQYPKGEMAKVEQYNDLVSVKLTGIETQKRYENWIKKFPEAKDNTDLIYDYARSQVAYRYATEDNVKMHRKWLDMIKSATYKSQIEILDANNFLEVKDTVTAENLMRNGVIHKKTTLEGDPNPLAKSDYYRSLSALAGLLYKQHKYKDAFAYASEAYNGSEKKTLAVSETYALAAVANGGGKDAFQILTDEMRSGKANLEVKRRLNEAYRQEKGSDTGYDNFFNGLKAELAASVQAKLAKKMISEEAPEFTLTDLNGKKVSLAELKGKVVILDFWATWCGPCKKSFPAMQMALTKFKNDPNVVFLFIDTWERIPDPLKDIKSFINEHQYTFQVLLDNKTTGVVEKYGITGIPAKFVIAPNGKITFKLTGFDGGEDAAVEELSAMIEIARKQI